MKQIKITWMEDQHKLSLYGTFTSDDWHTSGQSTCLLHCKSCDAWWPLSGFFINKDEASNELRKQSIALHNDRLLRSERS